MIEQNREIAVPSLAVCAQLMEKYGMLTNIRHHSLVVALVAAELHRGLVCSMPKRPQADFSLIVTGALLHDIAKTPCLGGKCRHAELGAQICLAEGFPVLAEIVLQHVKLVPFAEHKYQAGFFDAASLVFYADKRVRHHELVSLEERCEDAVLRYGGSDKDRISSIRRHFQDCSHFEELLFQWLPFAPNELRLSASGNEEKR